jgi:hypothetical protein
LLLYYKSSFLLTTKCCSYFEEKSQSVRLLCIMVEFPMILRIVLASSSEKTLHLHRIWRQGARNVGNDVQINRRRTSIPEDDNIQFYRRLLVPSFANVIQIYTSKALGQRFGYASKHSESHRWRIRSEWTGCFLSGWDSPGLRIDVNSILTCYGREHGYSASKIVTRFREGAFPWNATSPCRIQFRQTPRRCF